MAKMKTLDWISIILLIVGGLAWGIVGLFGVNIVEMIFRMSWLIKTVYILVGASSLYSIYTFGKILLK